MKMNMVGKNKPEVVIDIKNSYNPKTDDFAGLYMAKIGTRCIVAEDTIILTSIVNDTFVPVVCNILTGKYQVLDSDGRHFTVHDSVYDSVLNTRLIVGCRSYPLQAPHIVIGRFETDQNDKDQLKLFCDTIGDIVKLDNLPQDHGKYIWKTLQHNPHHIIEGKVQTFLRT